MGPSLLITYKQSFLYFCLFLYKNAWQKRDCIIWYIPISNLLYLNHTIFMSIHYYLLMFIMGNVGIDPISVVLPPFSFIIIMVPFNKTFVCSTAMPGLGCGYPEMLILGLLFLFCGLLTIFLLIRYIKLRTKIAHQLLDYQIIFWVFMTVWFIYRSIIQIIPFHYNLNSYYIFGVGLNHILFLGSLSIVILIVLDQLYQYQGIETTHSNFFKFLFVLYIIIFLITGISASLYGDEEIKGTNSLMFLWHACSSLIIALFVYFPSKKLIKTISYPVVQPGNVVCVRISNVFLYTFLILFFLRSLSNILTFAGVHPIAHLEKESDGTLGGGARAFYFLTNFLFDLIPALQACYVVYAIFKHDLDFQNDYFYSPH